jgi:hypothetical protein
MIDFSLKGNNNYASSTTGAAICTGCGVLVDMKCIKVHIKFHSDLEERFKAIEDLLRIDHP